MAPGENSVGSVNEDSSSDAETSVTSFRTVVLEKCSQYEQRYDPLLAASKKHGRYVLKMLLPRVRSPRPYPVAGPLELPPRPPRFQSSNPAGIDAPNCRIADCNRKVNRSMLLRHYMNSHSDFQLHEVYSGVPLRLEGNYAQLLKDTNFCMGIIAYKGQVEGASPYQSALATLNFVDTADTCHLQESLPVLVMARKMEFTASEKLAPDAKGDGKGERVSKEKLIIWITAAFLKGTNVHCRITVLDANNGYVANRFASLHQMCYTPFPRGHAGYLTLDYERIKKLLSASEQGTFHLKITFDDIYNSDH